MWGIILVLLVAWLVISVLGLLIKGLLWLFFIGVVLFLATSAWGWLKRNS